MLKFYFHHTPNPMKVALLLEELGLAHELVPVDTYKGEQHSPAFRAVNPNGKVPAILDGDTAVFDSNAILLYIAEKQGRFLGAPADRGQLLSWLMFVATGIGPYSGQAVHFKRVHTESPYASNRYRREVERHYTVLDTHLKGRAHIVGDDYTIVDMAAWGWIDRAPIIFGPEAPLAPWPEIKRWFDAVNGRPAVAAVRRLVASQTFKTDFDEETKRNLFPTNYPPA